MSGNATPAPPTPLLDAIDDPSGLVGAIPEGEDSPGRATAYFVKRVQEIRWELYAMSVDLDAIEGFTPGASMLLPQAIDLLGVVARSEAAYHDLPEGDVPAHRLFQPPQEETDD